MVEPFLADFCARTLAELDRLPFRGLIDDVLDQDHYVRDGLWLEFGVATGTSLRKLAAARGSARLFGFDWFQGLPEDWRAGYPKGTFACAPPNIDGATLVVGLFQDTLPCFNFDAPVTLVHVDCDIYLSAIYVLRAVAPHLAPGAIVVFDELIDDHYPEFEQHEMRAVHEMAMAGLRYDWIARGKCTMRVAGPLGVPA